MPHAQNFKVSLAPHITLTEMDGKLVLFSKQSGDFFGLNESALLLLKTLLASDFKSTVTNIAVDVGEKEERIAADLMELVNELESHQLIYRAPLS